VSLTELREVVPGLLDLHGHGPARDAGMAEPGAPEEPATP
jgi:hypothetical protein